MTTKADAVNRVLNLVGKMDQASPAGGGSPAEKTDTAEGSSSSSTASYVERFLDRCSRQVQEMGWYWNTETDVTIALTSAGLANLPTPAGGTGEILRIDTVGSSRRTPVVMKDDSGVTRLFNLIDNDFTFDSDLEVEFQYEVRFDFIPEPFMDFVIAKTALDVNMAYQFRPELQSQLAMLVGRQEMLMNKDQMKQGDVNILATREATAIRGRFSHTSRRGYH